MSTKRSKAGAPGSSRATQKPIGAWSRSTGRGPANPIRVRTKRLDEIDGDKIAIAYWLLAKRIVENGSDVPVTEEEARRVASEVESSVSRPGGSPSGKRGDRS
jgi:hypothetical protein